MPSLISLRKAGFKKSARWALDDSGRPGVFGNLPPEPGIYLFVVNGKIRYVGMADASLHKRLLRYAGAMRRGQGSRAVHKGIDVQLATGGEVGIYTYAQPKRVHELDGLPIDLVLGLEAGLIEVLDPEWNSHNAKGRKKRAALLSAEA